MKAERLKKAHATREAKSAKFKTQVIPIDDDWQISRFDELNWEIRYKGKFYGYYGSLLSALQALPAKMMSEEVSHSIGDIQQCTRAFCQRIETALNMKFA